MNSTMPTWKSYKLEELGTLGRGKSKYRPRDASHLYGGKYPFIQTGDVKSAIHKIYKYTQTYSEAGLEQSKLWKTGTLCITIAANIADTAILTFPACFPDSILGFVADPKKCDVEFIEYMLQYYQKRIQQHSIGSVQENINLGTFRNVDFKIPDLPTQIRIAEILSALDDKIELNRRMNQTLEQMAQTLFSQYFVDGIDKDNLPKGWRLGRLKEIVSRSKASIKPASEPDIAFMHYSIPAFDSSQRPSKELGSTILSNKFVVKSNSILFSKLNPRLPRVWCIGDVDERIAICSTELLVFVPLKPEWYSFSYLQLANEKVINDLVGKATGTSGSHQRVRPDDILDLDIIMPTKEKAQDFEIKIRPLIKKKIQNLKEVSTLTKTRDTLLSKLMSGEIDVMQAQKQYEQVLS